MDRDWDPPLGLHPWWTAPVSQVANAHTFLDFWEGLTIIFGWLRTTDSKQYHRHLLSSLTAALTTKMWLGKIIWMSHLGQLAKNAARCLIPSSETASISNKNLAKG
jgi:hypothetical protein